MGHSVCDCVCQELPSDAVILSSKYGQLYQCTYPPVPSQANSRVNDSQANNVSVSELLNPMKQLPCLFTVCTYSILHYLNFYILDYILLLYFARFVGC